MGPTKRPVQKHRARRAPLPPPSLPMVIGTQPKAPRYVPPPTRPSSVVVVAAPRAVSQPPDSTSAKLLVIASLLSLVVVMLSLAVLSRTTGSWLTATTPEPAPLAGAAAAAPVAPVAPAAPAVPVAEADLMLMLDVEPKDASVRVRRSADGVELEVEAEGYESEVRTIESGVRGKIAVKLAKKELGKKKKKKKKALLKKVAKEPGKPGSEVFLTGGDL